MYTGNKLKKIPKAAKASVAFLFASIVSKGISYIMLPFYTRVLSSSEYGRVTVFLTWVSVFGTIAMFRLSAGVFNNGMVDYPDRRDEYAFSMLILSNIITVFSFVFLLAVYPLLRKWIDLDIPLLFLMFAICLFQPAYNFWVARQRYEMKYKAVTWWTLAMAIFSPVIATACILFTKGNRAYARVFGAEGTLVLFYIGFYVYLAAKNKWKINTDYWNAAFQFNLPLIPHYLSSYLLGSADKIMISELVNDSATAYYGVAYSIASVANIVWSAVNASLIPYTYEKCKKLDYKSISNVTMHILTIFAVLSLLVILLAPEIIAVVAAKDYQRAIYVIPPVVGGVFFQIQYFIYANIIYYYKQPRYVMYASITAMGLNIVLNYIFISYFGFIAAGYTTIFCYFLQASIDYWAMKKVVGRSVYNMRYLGVLSMTVVIAALISNLIYDHAVFRYLAVALMSLIMFVFRRKILDKFRWKVLNSEL